MDGIRLTTLSRFLADACERSPETTEALTRWIVESRTAGARTATEIRSIGYWVKRRLCHPKEPFADCPALTLGHHDDPSRWCQGCTPEVVALVDAVDSFPERLR